MFGVAAALVLVLSFVALAALWSTPRLQSRASGGWCGCRSRSTSCSARRRWRLRRRRLRRARGQRRRAATTSPRRWSTSPSGSASRSPRCCSATSSRLLSPWRALGRAAGLGRGARVRGATCRRRSPTPSASGRWPAAAGLVGFGDLRAVLGARRREPAPLALLDARLLRRDARRDEPLRRRARGRATPTRSASISACSRSLAPLGRARGRRCCTPRVPLHRRGRARPRRRARRRCCSRDRHHGVRRRQRRARSSTTSRPHLQDFFGEPRALARRRRSSSAFVVGLACAVADRRR